MSDKLFKPIINQRDKEDKLKDYRGSLDNSFYTWIKNNCHNAKSHEEVRKILSKLKKPIRLIIG